MATNQSYAVVDRHDHTAVVTLNRPKELNAFSREDSPELAGTLRRLNGDDSVRVIIVTGAGRGFCAGADVAGIADTERTPWNKFVESVADWILAFDDVQKPLLAAVNGVAAGAGFSFAMACDIRLASESARFVASWSNIGLVPDAGSSHYLPRLIGFAKAAQLVLTGQTVDARTALEWGLVSEVLPDEELMPRALELAAQIAANPPLTVALSKQVLRQGAETPLRQQILNETAASHLTRFTEDRAEAIAAFMGKRAPRFKGQ